MPAFLRFLATLLTAALLFVGGLQSGAVLASTPKDARAAAGSEHGVNKTAAFTVTSSLNITTPATLQSLGQVALSASVTYADNSSKAVAPVWNSSDPAASVSANGILYAGEVTVDTPVTLTATYSEGGLTLSTSKTVVLTAAPATLISISIAGITSMQDNAKTTFKATASYSDGSQRTITPTWSVISFSYGFLQPPISFASITPRGVLTVGDARIYTWLRVGVTAAYSEGNLTKSISQTVSVLAPVIPTPCPPPNTCAAPGGETADSLSIIGAQGSLTGGATLVLNAEALYSDGSRRSVAATWSVSNADVATITPSGNFTANKIIANTPVTVTATYGGKSANYVILVLAAPDTSAGSRIQTEVTTQGTLKNFGLSVVVKLDSAVASRFAVVGGYQVFVAAQMPAGNIVAVPTTFVLDRANNWAPQSWPLKAFLDGVQDASEVVIDILSEIDVTALSGSTVYVGWGTSANEMLAATPYTPVFTVP